MKKKKKIIFVVNTMNIGGTEKSLLNLINAMDATKFAVTVLMLEEAGGYLNYLPLSVEKLYVDKDGDIKATADIPLPYQIKNSLFKGKFLKALKLLKLYLAIKGSNNWNLQNKYSLKNFSLDVQFDIAVAYAGPYFLISELVISKISAKVKYQWIHFDISCLNLSHKLGETLFSKFDKIFCVSPKATVKFIEQYPNMNMKTFCFENIINRKEAKELAGKVDIFVNYPGYLKILTVGRLSEEKNQVIIPEICFKLKEKRIKFKWFLIGDGPLRSNILQKAKELNVEEFIILLGTKTNPYPYFKFCDIYVQTSLQEGYCITVEEAKLFSKPIVMTNVASAEDLITHGEDGFITDVSPEKIFDLLYLLALDKDLQTRFAFKLEDNRLLEKISLVERYFEYV